MKAVVFDRYGGPDVLSYVEVPDPVCMPGEVLIRIKAIGVNPADGKWRSGMFDSLAPVPFPHVGGYDVAGLIEGGDEFALGTRVVAMVLPFRSGAYAEWTVTTPDRVAVLADSLDFATGAAVPTPGLTGFELIAAGLDVQAGQRVLITGALGTVGRFAVFAAKARGATVIAAVRPNMRDAALALGADEAIALGEAYDGAPFDRVADTTGGTLVASLCAHVTADAILKTVATNPIPSAGLGSEVGFFMVHPDAAQLAAVVSAVASRKVEVPIADRLALSAAAQAQARVDAGGTGGKIVLEP